jgi:hypothetical protein
LHLGERVAAAAVAHQMINDRRGSAFEHEAPRPVRDPRRCGDRAAMPKDPCRLVGHWSRGVETAIEQLEFLALAGP